MSVSAFSDRALSSAPYGACDDQHVSALSAAKPSLFVIPRREGNGFRVSVRGHLLDLADPDAGHGLAPTPKDLAAAALASDVAWFARRFLRSHELDDDVSVSAGTSTSEGLPTWCSFDVRVDISQTAAAIGTTLAAALKERLAAHASDPPRIEVRTV